MAFDWGFFRNLAEVHGALDPLDDDAALKLITSSAAAKPQARMECCFRVGQV